MIIYNVTVKIDTNQYEDWLNWMKSEHIPKVMATGFFLKNDFMNLKQKYPYSFYLQKQFLNDCHILILELVVKNSRNPFLVRKIRVKKVNYFLEMASY